MSSQKENKLKYHMYSRYVDDTVNGVEALAPGMRWGEEERCMVFLPHLVDDDKEVADDMRTMREVIRMDTVESTRIEPFLGENRVILD